jgi:hypothetical protein
VAIVLGKDCVVNIGGQVFSARQVSVQRTARTIDVEEFGSRMATVYATGYETVLTCEFNDASDSVGFRESLIAGQEMTVSSTGGAGLVMPAIITSFTESQPVDGVVTWIVEARLCRTGIQESAPSG